MFIYKKVWFHRIFKVYVYVTIIGDKYVNKKD